MRGPEVKDTSVPNTKDKPKRPGEKELPDLEVKLDSEVYFLPTQLRGRNLLWFQASKRVFFGPKTSSQFRGLSTFDLASMAPGT